MAAKIRPFPDAARRAEAAKATAHYQLFQKLLTSLHQLDPLSTAETLFIIAAIALKLERGDARLLEMCAVVSKSFGRRKRGA